MNTPPLKRLWQGFVDCAGSVARSSASVLPEQSGTLPGDDLDLAISHADLLKSQISQYVPKDAQKRLAAAGIRDEHVFPLPAILEHRPTLVGYYRLMLGISQKRFYRKGTDMGPFKSMESRGLINGNKRPDLESFCTVMSEHLAELVRQISPGITARDVSELPLLTLGAQLYGSNNNAIGRKATLMCLSRWPRS